ncbi:MAG: FKBP-type peptidyl-prolyl cis-trans isomerase [Nitrospira sp.]|nr:FKBP-type peptidyl-prolyl cis-trans isomerase [bacterium]MBL7049757.1 FKBP-type peptidyl-prolyl cis-trans isomerase [Nitrospira sp.]
MSIFLLAGAINAEGGNDLKTEKDRVSYSIGMDIGGNLKSQGIDIDPEILAQGLVDTFKGENTKLTQEEFSEAMTNFQKKMMAKQAELQQAASGNNAKEGETFLSENKTKDGVVELPSGLQYIIVSEGSGDSPKATDTVSVHYKGTLIDGTEFDSSYGRGEPAEFPVNRVIPGWTEALQLMKPGAKWQLFIPSDLAYGERGAGKMIGPNSALIFDVELLAIK